MVEIFGSNSHLRKSLIWQLILLKIDETESVCIFYDISSPHLEWVDVDESLSLERGVPIKPSPEAALPLELRKYHHQVYQLSLSECKNQSTKLFFFRIYVKIRGSLFLCFLVRHTCEMWSSAGGRAGTRGRGRAAAGDSTRTTNWVASFTVATVKA